MRIKKRFHLLFLIVLPLGILAVPACKANSPVPFARHSITIADTAAPISQRPETLLTLERPAYHAIVHLDGEVVYLLTNDAIFLLVPGQAPRGRKLDLGNVVAATSSAFIYWSKRALWSIPKSGGDPSKLYECLHSPQYLLAADGGVAWIDRAEGGTYQIYAYEAGKAKQIYTTQNMVTAATLIQDRLIIAERVKTGGFYLASISLDGGSLTKSLPREGRPPSMLAGFDKQIAYYDGNVFEVRLLATDLSTERVVGSDLICSPLDLADRVYCGQVQGLYALSLSNHAIALLQPSEQSMVTAIDANAHHVAYVLDKAGKLEVQRISFR